MKDIVVLIIEKEKRKRPQQITVRKELMVPCSGLSKEIDDYGLDGEVNNLHVSEIPQNINADLVVILDEDTYVPEDFINRVVSFNNLFRDAGVLCGPVYPTLDSRFSKTYHTYELQFGSSVVSDITNEHNSFPSIVGCVITGRAYNQFMYKPTKGPRHISPDNSLFLSALSEHFKIYYSSKLIKAKILDKSDLTIDILSDYYYNLGYQDGLAVSYKSIGDKRKELFDRFVNSPEMFDNTMPRWLFEKTPESDGEYAEMLVLTKCKYQIGFYEGMIGSKVI